VKRFILIGVCTLALSTVCRAQPHIPVPNQGEPHAAPHADQRPGERNPFAANLVSSAQFLQQAGEIVEKRTGAVPAQTQFPISWDAAAIREVARQLRDFGTRLRGAVEAAELTVTGRPFGQSTLKDQQRQEINQLGRVSLDQFGTQYVQAMIGELQQRRQDLKSYTKDGSEPAYRNLAEQNLPEAESHLASLQKIEKTRR
jgi:hypothetical protein